MKGELAQLVIEDIKRDGVLLVHNQDGNKMFPTDIWFVQHEESWKIYAIEYGYFEDTVVELYDGFGVGKVAK